MATVIDGTTLNGHWKIYDDGSPNDYYQIPKDELFFYSSDTANGELYLVSDYGKSTTLKTTDNTTEDENGNALNTSAKVANYLSNNR